MKKQFISDPMDFHYKEGNAVDFAKTFDLTGNDNDQMLRVYLKKAGLSDNIECLTPEQRKAFIYDIVKSNKNPGYWKPSVLPPMSPNATVRSIRVPVEPTPQDTLTSLDDIPPASLSFDFKHFSQLNYASNGEQKTDMDKQEIHSPLYERQFQSQPSFSIAPKIYNTPPTPPSPSTLVTRKGLRIDISGPINFQHVSGDMTRDMTKNAFDLSSQFNDICLNKYMIERGITEDDIEGMDKKELIKKIVQSRYTWMPNRKQYTGSFIPPPPSETYRAPSPTAPPRHKHHSKGGSLIVPPPTLPSSNSTSNESIYMDVLQREPSHAPSIKPMNSQPPAPPTLVSNKVSHSHMATPPPPPPPPNQSQTVQVKASIETPTSTIPNDSKTITGNVSPIPPPPPFMTNLNATAGAPPPPPMPPMNSTSGVPPPPPPMPNMNGGVPPPPPPPPSSATHSSAKKIEAASKPVESGVDSRDALLESIRAGVSLKKVNKTKQGKPIVGTIKEPSNSPAKIPDSETEVPQKPVKSEKIDFMSELRNATLKRIKKLENNQHADLTSESQC